MKKILLLIPICLFAVQTMAQIFEPAKKVYKSPNLETAIKAHKAVAILPFDAQITYRKPRKYMDTAAHARQEQELGLNVQAEVYNAFMRDFYKYKVKFQNVMETNALLEKNGMTGELDMFTKQEICQALGVDAIILGEFVLKENTPGLGTVAAVMGGYDKTAEITITMKIANAADGEILWRYTKRMNEMRSTDEKDAFDRQMESLPGIFPIPKVCSPYYKLV